MKNTIFLSDVHLTPAVPGRTEKLVGFLQRERATLGELYFLGDLFEFWLGRQHLQLPDYQDVIGELARLTKAGVKTYFIHGNRDFHVDGSFQRRTGVRVLGDSAEVSIAGRRALLMHGDMLCTDDVHYHSYRRFARCPVGKSLFKALPIVARRLLAKCMTHASSIGERSEDSGARSSISKHEVMEIFQAGYDFLVCGHIHTPGVHRMTVNGVKKVLYVLGSWDERGTYLECDKETLRMKDAFDGK